MGMQQTYGGIARAIAPLFFGWSFDWLGVSSPYFFASAIIMATIFLGLGLDKYARHEETAAKQEEGTGLLVQIIQRHKLPASLCLPEVINNNFIACGVRTGYSKRFHVCRIHLWLCFTEAGCRIGLFVEDLPEALR